MTEERIKVQRDGRGKRRYTIDNYLGKGLGYRMPHWGSGCNEAPLRSMSYITILLRFADYKSQVAAEP
jgi:hypothetical protein